MILNVLLCLACISLDNTSMHSLKDNLSNQARWHLNNDSCHVAIFYFGKYNFKYF